MNLSARLFASGHRGVILVCWNPFYWLYFWNGLPWNRGLLLDFSCSGIPWAVKILLSAGRTSYPWSLLLGIWTVCWWELEAFLLWEIAHKNLPLHWAKALVLKGSSSMGCSGLFSHWPGMVYSWQSSSPFFCLCCWTIPWISGGVYSLWSQGEPISSTCMLQQCIWNHQLMALEYCHIGLA